MASSPAPSPVRPDSSDRRRSRSRRQVLVVALLVLGLLAVVVAAVSGSWAVATAAAVLILLAGAAGCRLQHTETVQARRDGARDRARQARDYQAITVRRTEEQAVHDATMTARMAKQDATVSRLEHRLGEATDEVRSAHHQLETERARLAETTRRHDDLRAAKEAADRDHERLTARLDDAEERLADAVVRVVELEQELDVVLAEWRSGATAPHRKHA